MSSTTAHSFTPALVAARAVEREASHLHDVEHAGESEWTPWILLAGLVLFFGTVIAVLTALTFAAYSLGH
jgi:hypothetical protein